jgi:hypothetical protein
MNEALCECGHPQGNYSNGRCSAEISMKDYPNRVVLCDCNQFESNHEDVSQSAALIVSGGNEY